MHAVRSPYVLIVEDDPDVRVVLAIALADQYRVETAATGQEAVAKAQQETPDVLVLDWSLPDMSGDELIAKLGPGFDSMGRVVVSGISGLGGLAGRIGAVACPKPCTIEKLVAAIEKALNA